ncbi:MAG: hypothetical protein KGL39_28225 [Patescibacteria group bacterium]|nr:hypothetical protein [Patescibacteria group bacterium]
MSKPEPMILLSDARGIYIPRDFAEEFGGMSSTHGLTDEDLKILSDPDHDLYWETWDDVLNDVTLHDDSTGVTYSLYQDGDLWAIPEGMEWSDKDEFFVWPQE